MLSRLVENITAAGELIAIVLRREFNSPGANFFTPVDLAQQLGMLVYEKGRVVRPHKHRPFKRETETLTEVLVVLSGRLKIDLYDREARFLQTVILETGDSILFASGGHGVEVLEDARILEVKQGPYIGQEEKEFL